MNPGSMRDLIRVYRDDSAQQGSGYVNRDRVLVCQVYARRADATTREVWEAYAAKARSVVNFEIRPRQDVGAGMLVESRGQVYEIIAVQHLGPAPGRMVLKTTVKEGR